MRLTRSQRVARFNRMISRIALEAPRQEPGKVMLGWSDSDRKHANEVLAQFRETAAGLSAFADRFVDFKQIKEMVSFLHGTKPVIKRLAELINSF